MSFNSKPAKALVTYICGESGPLDDFNPFLVLKQKWAPELLYLLNKHPFSADQISSKLKINQRETIKILEDLARIEAVKEKSGAYHVAFSIFTGADLEILKRATRPIAIKLCKSISMHLKEITSLIQDFSSVQQVENGKLLFAALGCFVLDWLGLKTLEEEGLLIKSKPQPGNRNYLLFAREKVGPNTAAKLYDRMYWGSNSDTVSGFVFTSFGDHSGIRYAFPDILWTLRASHKMDQSFHELPLWMTEKGTAVAGLLSEKLSKDVGLLLFRLNVEGPVAVRQLPKDNDKTWVSNLLDLLEDMGYIIRERDRFKLDYPVFVAKDKKVIKKLGNLIAPLIIKTILGNYSNLQMALSGTTPIKNRIEFNEVLTEAWHWIFAQTNCILAEKGFLYDPPRKRVRESRYMAWVSEFGFP